MSGLERIKTKVTVIIDLKIEVISSVHLLQKSDLTRFSYRISLFRVQLFVRLCFQTIAQSISMNSGTFVAIFGTDFDGFSMNFIDIFPFFE